MQDIVWRIFLAGVAVVMAGLLALLLRLLAIALWRGATATGRATPGAFSLVGWLIGRVLLGPADPKRRKLTAMKADYDNTVSLLGASGLEPHELSSALAEAKKLYMRKLDQAM